MAGSAVLASIIAAETSAGTFIGTPGEGYAHRNFTYLQLALGTIMARIVIAVTFLKPYYDYNVYSIYEFLKVRFGPVSRNAASAVFLITRVLASGTRLYISAVILVLAAVLAMIYAWSAEVVGNVAMITGSFLAGILAGALWGLIPAVLKAFLSVNEITTSLMLNYVAILWIQYLYYGPWRDPQGFGFPGTAEFAREAWLPRLRDTEWLPQLFSTGRLHWGLVLAIVAAIVVWLMGLPEADPVR